ncbi:3-oxoacyl-[acyl-carrier protein] reductase [Asanoa ferruginea]|uniref:3-oxoacyl-[acyl-carrier protein] reductase n=1 Tax=Asanoa ferruginea TaxID=53367 RepID=A0A3D9ZRQ2_9ACTN|nr:SDR family oxidoreductase [Asanoa ferruginea]REF99905.1 3-oxoacyl-[acyl-carrier protein] reductase [Asanoa ferruginea]GIF51634.1 3-oxoacyl-ACP reductase [Asanoa ferruginea]
MTTALVGGASAGLGAAIAERLAADGNDLLLWSRSTERLDPIAATLHARHGVKVHTVAADAADPTAAATVADRAEELFGGVDICVLNAGGPPPATADKTNADDWRKALQLLTITPIDLATRLLPGMRERGHGRIVAVLSSGVREPLPNLTYSNSGRAALAAWIKTAGREVAADGVTVNGVVPGRIDTDRVAQLDAAAAKRTGTDEASVRAASIATIPAGRYGDPQEFAAVVGFLAGPTSSYVTASLLSCDGGLMRSMT